MEKKLCEQHKDEERNGGYVWEEGEGKVARHKKEGRSEVSKQYKLSKEALTNALVFGRE